MGKYEKKLTKLSNGYSFELITDEKYYGWGNNRIVFFSFFNKFGNSYLLQTARQYVMIDKSKSQGEIKPYIESIEGKETEKDEMYRMCLKNLELVLERDPLKETCDKKVYRVVDKTIYDYSVSEFHYYISNPLFKTWNINNQKEEKKNERQ